MNSPQIETYIEHYEPGDYKLSLMVASMQKSFSGKSFFSLAPSFHIEEMGPERKDHFKGLNISERPYLFKDHPEHATWCVAKKLIFTAKDLPHRFEHLLQLVRSNFPGIGFDQIVVSISADKIEIFPAF